jgi:ABC-type multidrug transport system ATPase subunit
MSDAIQAEGLVKRFGETVALAGVDLSARTGTVLAVLGPNGAGKTTAVRILATLLQPDQGRATVAGYDVVRHAHQVRQLIALTGQYAAVDETLTGVENLCTSAHPLPGTGPATPPLTPHAPAIPLVSGRWSACQAATPKGRRDGCQRN